MGWTLSRWMAAVALGLSWVVAAAATAQVMCDVRVEALSPTVIRLEVKGPHGFEDRPTFRVLHRSAATPLAVAADGDHVALRGNGVIVRLPKNPRSLDGAEIDSTNGALLWKFDPSIGNDVWLPAPGSHPTAWAFADTPRIARSDNPSAPHTGNVGWDISNNAEDVYVFLPHGSYTTLRQDVLNLTGPTEMPPLWALGAWDSRWFEYTEESALKQIADYRAHHIPLDGLVIDTDWRNGGSHGYDINTHDFPNISRFFGEAHAAHVHVMFNDHPEPQAGSALAPKELAYRTANVDRLLNDGLDVWWYDRNWSTHLQTPLPGLHLEVWGMELYHDLTAADKPDIRPMIMANVDGIDNGARHHPPDMAAHRFPIQWTGDISPSFAQLRVSISNAVHAGVAALFPYESDDLGGHIADPTPEGFVRWIEYGALSPIYRPHCTKNHERMPWTFGPRAEAIARKYVRMRYRLLPMFYAAAHQNYLTGEPMLRRLDLDFSNQPKANREDEYLLGHDLLVAPIMSSTDSSVPVPDQLLTTPQGKPGLAVEYYANDRLSGRPVLSRTDANVKFDWGYGSPAAAVPVDHFSARWTGNIGPVPSGHGPYVLSVTSDDGVRVWIDGNEVIDQWKPLNSITSDAKIQLLPGKRYRLRIEYMELTNNALCKLSWRPAQTRLLAKRSVWMPPGTWINLWTGKANSSAGMIQTSASLRQIPLWVRSGSIVLLAPQMQYSAEKPWSPVTIDLYPDAVQPARATLYEDDGITTGYRHGQFRTTSIAATGLGSSNIVNVSIAAAQGNFNGAMQQRSWVLRVHSLAGHTLERAMLDGHPLHVTKLPRDATAMPLNTDGGVPDGNVVEIRLPAGSVNAARDVRLDYRGSTNEAQ